MSKHYYQKRNERMKKKQDEDMAIFWIGFIGFLILLGFFVN